MAWWIGVIIAIMVAIIIIFFLFAAFVAYKLVKPERFVGYWTPKDFGADYEDIELKTEDDVKLKGWHIKGGENCVVLLHGYSRSRWDDVYIRKVMEKMWSAGYSVLAVDFRAHGESEGKYTTLGDKEILDVKAMVKYADQHCKKVYIIGYSMGGFLALKAAYLGLVDKVVADSPYIYTDKTGARGLKYFANLPEWLYAFVKPFAILLSGAKYENTNPFKFARSIKVPTLIIAGKKDPLVKIEEIEEFLKVATNVKLWVTEGAHVRSILVNEEDYINRILQFFTQ